MTDWILPEVVRSFLIFSPSKSVSYKDEVILLSAYTAVIIFLKEINNKYKILCSVFVTISTFELSR